MARGHVAFVEHFHERVSTLSSQTVNLSPFLHQEGEQDTGDCVQATFQKSRFPSCRNYHQRITKTLADERYQSIPLTQLELSPQETSDPIHAAESVEDRSFPNTHRMDATFLHDPLMMKIKEINQTSRTS